MAKTALALMPLPLQNRVLSALAVRLSEWDSGRSRWQVLSLHQTQRQSASSDHYPKVDATV